MKKNSFIIISLLILFGLKSHGQISTDEKPVSFSLKPNSLGILKSAVQTSKSLPALDMEIINQEDIEDEENGMPPRFGFMHEVDYNLNNSGTWTILSDGSKIWQLEIICPKALSINLLYDKFQLPDSAKFFVYSSDQNHSIGAFTSKNNKGTKDNIQSFATGLIYSDRVILEYYLPAGIEEEGVISVAYIVHGYKYIDIGENNFTKNAEFGKSGSCNKNINCSEGLDWQDEKNAVALILVNGNRYCTGSLINTTANDTRPLFLTADHCLGGWANSKKYDAINDYTLFHWSFYWHYESPVCNSNIEPPIYSTVGAYVVANNSNSDFALLELIEDPKNKSGVSTYYLGWDRTGNPGIGGVGIHHPHGDLKKIAKYNIMPISTAYNNYTENNNSNHWKVVWSSGITEGGSSGSPLLNKMIIGHFAYNSF